MFVNWRNQAISRFDLWSLSAMAILQQFGLVRLVEHIEIRAGHRADGFVRVFVEAV